MALGATRRDGLQKLRNISLQLGGLELVGLRENQVESPASLGEPSDEFDVDLLRFVPGVDQHKDAPKVWALQHVVGDELLKKSAPALGDLREAVAGQVHKTKGPIDAEKIDELGATRCLRNSGELLVSHEKIQKGGFADIRAPDEGNLRHIVLGTINNARETALELSGLDTHQALIDEAPRQVAVRLNPPVAQEGPVRPLGIDFFKIDLDHQNLLFVHGRAGNDFSGRIRNEALTPKFQARPAIRCLMADSVRRSDIATIRNRMSTLNGFPRGVLAFAIFLLLGGMPTDRRRVEQNLRPLKGRETRRFGIPLVPANTHADPTESRVPSTETQIAGSEVKLFVKERVVRNVHLPVFAEKRSVGIDDRRRVVIKARRSTLEERGDQNDSAFLRNSLHRLGRRSRDGFGEFEVFVILDLAKIHRGEKLLETHDVRAFRGSGTDPTKGSVDVRPHIGRAGVLDKSDFHLGGLHTVIRIFFRPLGKTKTRATTRREPSSAMLLLQEKSKIVNIPSMPKAFPLRPRTATDTSFSYAIVASQFNDTFVQPLVDHASRELAALEPSAQIEVFRTPGSFEIPVFVQAAADLKRFHAILALGVVFQGETGHATLIAESVTKALLDISIAHRVPVIHEVLFVKNEEQAKERCLGLEHNRGIEAARAAVLAARNLSEVA